MDPSHALFCRRTRGLLPVQTLTIDVHETGLVLAERYGFSVYEAIIAASALHADCSKDGLLLDGRLRIVNALRA